MKNAEGRKDEEGKQAERLQLTLNPKLRMKDSNSKPSRKEEQAERSQLALDPRPRMKDSISKPSRKAKRIVPTRGGLAMYPRYPSADMREEVNSRAMIAKDKTTVALSSDSEDELTSARDSPRARSEFKINHLTPRTPRKTNLSEDKLEQQKFSDMTTSTNEDVTMLGSETPAGDGFEVPRTRTSTLRPTRGAPRGRGAGQPRFRASSNEDDKSPMPIARAPRYQTRAAQPMASEPAPYHTYPPRKYLELSVQRFELPDDRPQGPGNLWACQRPGCAFREHNAVSAAGLERVRSHIQHHADEDAKREPFFENPFRDDPNHPNHIPAWA